MTRTIITGASGFLGRAVTTRLETLRLPYLAVSRRKGEGLHGITDYSETPYGSVLIHLAEEPNRSIVNALGEAYLKDTASLLRTLLERASIVIYASSGVVYGDEGDKPFRPDASVFPTDIYSRSKVLNEKIVLDAGGTVVRLSNLFGLGMSTSNVISDIDRQLQNTGALIIKDDKPVRDFLSVNAAADAIVLLSQIVCPGILNLGSGMGVSVRELALLALSSVDQLDRDIVVTHPSSRLSVNILDVEETQRFLGWTSGIPPLIALGNFFSRNNFDI